MVPLVSPPLPLEFDGLAPTPPGVQRVELDRTHTVIVHALLRNPSSAEVIARATNWPEPLKHLDPVDPGLQLTVAGEEDVTISVQKPVKGLVLDVEGDERVKWSDNAIDVMPGDPQTVRARGLGQGKVTVAYLGAERSQAFAD
jgi:beta-mannosidase